MTEFGIFDDQAADYTAEEALEAQFYSADEAERRLAAMREDYGENAAVHAVEEPEEDEDEDE